MPKFLFLCLFTLLSLFADEKVKIYASSLETHDNIVNASDGITVIYEDYVLTSKRAKYNKENGDLELFENIRVNKGDNYKILGKYAKLNIAKKERQFKPFYMLNKESELWLTADEAKTKKEDVDVLSGTLSGCDPMNPIWTLDFSSTDYNTETKWMNIYNARIYIGDIPVLYTPYFGYSLDKTRRTGLLLPQIGFSNNEGVYYQQPFFIAEQNWWDLELKPQIRTIRGAGLYGTFRFVDSKSSHGEISTGYFKENQSYFLEKKLQNESHYGAKLKYDNNDFINNWFGTDIGGQSGVYVDVSHMNDVDYINLSSNDTENQQTSRQVFSRINLFHNTENNYIGAYFKYFQDLNQPDSGNTLQKLPTLHYHSYLDTFLNDHLLYSLDVQANNIQRTRNTSVIQTDINLPLTLRTSMFDEYLNLSYRANLYMQTSLFRGTGEEDDFANPLNIEYKDGYLARNSHTLTASTQLTRAYESFSHVVGLSLSYNKSGNDKKNGFYKDYEESNVSVQENYKLYQIQNIQDELRVNFVQYLYDEKGSEIFFHRLSQKVSYGASSDKLGELENELDYKITSYLSLYNNTFYNYNQKKFSKILDAITFNKYGVNLAFSHLYKDSFRETTLNRPRNTDYLTSNVRYNYNKHYSYSAAYNYDLEAKEQKSISVGFLYQKRCWDFGLRYSQNRRPILTNSGEADFISDRFIYLTVILKPLMKPNGDASFISYRFKEN